MHPALLAATSPYGVLMRSAVLEQGCEDDDLRAAVRAGELRRIRAGTYAWAEQWDSLDPRGRHAMRVRGVVLKAATDVVVSHAGVGTFVRCLEAGKAPVLVPRRASRGEHVDDHQLQIAQVAGGRGLAVVREVDELRAEDLVTAAGLRVVPA